jgi:formylglycine-generating enzyme required for sulfatase activity
MCYGGLALGIARVVRGGGWDNNNPLWVRGAFRGRDEPRQWNYDVGFRCSRGVETP